MQRITLARVWRGLVRRIIRPSALDELGTRLAQRKAREDVSLQPFLERYSLEQAREHFADVQVEEGYLREASRYFHARRVQIIAERLGSELESLSFLDVGDTDGLILKHLGKNGIGFNNSKKACEQIRRNGVEARLGDAQRLPFEDKSFDVVLCFETLEHVPNPVLMLEELSRVARKKIYVSIPGVKNTLVHSRIKGERLGEWHVIEFCEGDFRALLTHTSLRGAYYEPIYVFALPRGPRERLSYWWYATRQLFGGSFKFFQFYELEPAAEEQGLDSSAYWEPYTRRLGLT